MEFEVEFSKRSATVRVPSRTNGKVYNVIVTPDFMTCPCRAAQFGRPCWHKEAVRSFINGG